MTNNIEEKLKNSFFKVRAEIEAIKSQLIFLESRINTVSSSTEKDLKEQPFFEISNGNKGVINNHQQSSTIINNDDKVIKTIKTELNEQFKDLTDREFSIFLAIYSMEEELGRPIILHEIALKLKISEITVRGYINILISKNIPIIKERPFNRRIQLSINKNFRDLTLISKLLSIRNQQNNQKTLFEI